MKAYGDEERKVRREIWQVVAQLSVVADATIGSLERTSRSSEDPGGRRPPTAADWRRAHPKTCKCDECESPMGSTDTPDSLRIRVGGSLYGHFRGPRGRREWVPPVYPNGGANAINDPALRLAALKAILQDGQRALDYWRDGRPAPSNLWPEVGTEEWKRMIAKDRNGTLKEIAERYNTEHRPVSEHIVKRYRAKYGREEVAA